jgi:hypothetical protein
VDLNNRQLHKDERAKALYLAWELQQCADDPSSCSKDYKDALLSQLQDTLSPLCEGNAPGGCTQALNTMIAGISNSLNGNGQAKLELGAPG